MAFLVAFLLVLLHHGPSRNFRCTRAIAAAFLRALFDVFILPLFFIADTAEMLFTRHMRYLYLTKSLAISLPTWWR